MYGQNQKTTGIEDVRFYFDGVRTDSLDVSGVSRRNGELLALRPHLMKLSDVEYEAVMKAFWGVLSSSVTPEADKKPKRRAPSYPDATRLYEESSIAGGSSVDQISPV